jgi:hypothetical protein
MTHLRIDTEKENSKRKFACGIGPALPPGDTYFFDGESGATQHVDCLGCNPGGPRKLGTPISELTYVHFVEIGRSWGYP